MGEITYGTLSLEELTSVSGLDYFRGVIDGTYPHPPIAAHTRMRVTEIEKGKITWAVRAPETMINPMGAVHGGFAMTVLDSALGCAVHVGVLDGRQDMGTVLNPMQAAILRAVAEQRQQQGLYYLGVRPRCRCHAHYPSQCPTGRRVPCGTLSDSRLFRRL